ncbi:MAG: YwqG family protein [Methylococcales bacterium]|nr:YwqG family protein [Methylococcales bacterium]
MSLINLQKNWEQLKPHVSHLYRSALRLSKTNQITQTKLGGKPSVDLNSFQWPHSGGEPLAFVAQLDLTELARTLVIKWLPITGILLFFYDIETMPSGLNTEDSGLWKIIYSTKADTEANFPYQLAAEFQFDTYYLNATKITQLPSLERSYVTALQLTDVQKIAYEELYDREIGDQPSHQVAGFPDCIHDDTMEKKCHQLVETKGNKKDNWRLLLQLDSDENAEMIWGDCGVLYFWVRERDACVANFDDVRLIFQCY